MQHVRTAERRDDTTPSPTPNTIGTSTTQFPGAVCGTIPNSGIGGIGPGSTTVGECSESVAVMKPTPDHQAAAHAITVGAKAT